MKPLVPLIIFGIGVVVIAAASILGWIVVPNIIEDKIEEQVQLVEGSDTWKKWQTNPVPVYLKFHLFNVTNPDAIEKLEKPNLVEVGPYVFREIREKYDIEVDEEEDTVRYKQRIIYHFEPEMSEGSLDDVVNIINGAFLIVSTVIFTQLGPESPIGHGLVDYLISEGESFVKTNVTVGDVLFDGFQLPEEIYNVIFFLSGNDVPPEFEDFRFGYYRGKNGTSDGEYLINAGVKDSSKFGKIISWRNQTELDWWYPPIWREPERPNKTYCNQINGTDGSIFPPFVKKDTILRTFVSDVCRSMYMVYKEDIEHLDIPGYKFGFPPQFFLPPSVNEDNYCFCTSPKSEHLVNSCSGGVIRIFPCKSDGPIVTSSPHFLNANERFLDFLIGMKPEDSLHETYIQLEPNSGMMLKISKKVQISIELQRLATYTYFENTPNMLFPAFWAEETVELDEKHADELKSLLITPLKIVEISKWTVLGVGCLLVGIATAMFVYMKFSK